MRDCIIMGWVIGGLAFSNSLWEVRCKPDPEWQDIAMFAVVAAVWPLVGAARVGTWVARPDVPMTSLGCPPKASTDLQKSEQH